MKLYLRSKAAEETFSTGFRASPHTPNVQNSASDHCFHPPSIAEQLTACRPFSLFLYSESAQRDRSGSGYMMDAGRVYGRGRGTHGRSIGRQIRLTGNDMFTATATAAYLPLTDHAYCRGHRGAHLLLDSDRVTTHRRERHGQITSEREEKQEENAALSAASHSTSSAVISTLPDSCNSRTSAGDKNTDAPTTSPCRSRSTDTLCFATSITSTTPNFYMFKGLITSKYRLRTFSRGIFVYRSIISLSPSPRRYATQWSFKPGSLFRIRLVKIVR